MVYENTPGTWLGHAKYDIWVAPIYMVLDIVNAGTEVRSPPPLGYTIYKIDDEGCRVSAEAAAPPGADVVVLGSSQSFGLFVPQEDTVPAQLEKALGEHGLPGVHVGNCGVIGHHLLQTLRTGELRRASKHPRLNVVLVRPWHLREQVDYTKVISPTNAALRWAVHRSSLVRLSYYISRRDPNQFNKALVPTEVLEPRLDRYVREMAPSGVRTIFFLLDDKSEECALFDPLSALLQRKGLRVERIATPKGGRNEYFVDHDEHWSGKGAALTASQMVDAVAKELGAAAASPGR
jgi:hypothetical protein